MSPVKWQYDRKINPAEQIVRQHQGGRGDALALAGRRDVHHHAKIQMAVVEASDQPGRCFAQNRKYPDGVGGGSPVWEGRFQAKGRHQTIAPGQQRFDPSRTVRQHFFSRLPRIELGVVNRDTVGVAELRAGQ